VTELDCESARLRRNSSKLAHSLKTLTQLVGHTDYYKEIDLNCILMERELRILDFPGLKSRFLNCRVQKHGARSNFIQRKAAVYSTHSGNEYICVARFGVGAI
jgi:hypothetical protein